LEKENECTEKKVSRKKDLGIHGERRRKEKPFGADEKREKLTKKRK